MSLSTSLHFLVASWLDFSFPSFLLTFSIPPPQKKLRISNVRELTLLPQKSNRAPNRAQSPAALQQDFVVTEGEFTGDVALTDPLQVMANCLGSMILEVSQKVHGPDKAVEEQMFIPLTSLSRPQPGRKRARHQDSPAWDLDLDEDGVPEGRAKIEASSPGRRDHVSGG